MNLEMIQVKKVKWSMKQSYFKDFLFSTRPVRLKQLDKDQTSKPVMVSCEFNFHCRQLYFFAETF